MGRCADDRRIATGVTTSRSAAASHGAPPPVDQQGLELATFRIDVTPPVGRGVGFGLGERTTGIRDPLYLRGFLLADDRTACLVVTTDWCGLMNSAYRQIQSALAEGAGLPTDRVVVHASHQHDSPFFAFEIETLLRRRTYPRAYWRQVLRAARSAAAEARSRMQAVASVGHASTPVARYASARHVVSPDGRLLGNRWSRTDDPELVAASEGTIDPVLRTVGFRSPDGGLMASWSFYASHPQVASGRRLYSADAPGEALRIVDEADGVPGSAFFMGCAGNVTAGKYASFTDLEGNLRSFGARLAGAIGRNLALLAWERAGGLSWRTASFPFPADPGKSVSLRAELADMAVPEWRKQITAPLLAAIDDPGNAVYRLARLDLGAVNVLFLPGEPFVEYQLYAVGLDPSRFVAVASNCDGSPFYLPRAATFREGGYEVESFCWCTPEIEDRLESAIRDILA